MSKLWTTSRYLFAFSVAACCVCYPFHRIRQDRVTRWKELCYARNLMDATTSATTEAAKDKAEGELRVLDLSRNETKFIADCVEAGHARFIGNIVTIKHVPPRFERLPDCSLTYSEGLLVIDEYSLWKGRH